MHLFAKNFAEQQSNLIHDKDKMVHLVNVFLTIRYTLVRLLKRIYVSLLGSTFLANSQSMSTTMVYQFLLIKMTISGSFKRQNALLTIRM